MNSPFEFWPLPLLAHWHADAACREHPEPDLWHTETSGPLGRRLTNRAKAICRRCPVQTTCLAEHVAEPHGVWGGLDPRERREQRRQPTIARPQCGTDRGYQWHQRGNEHPCGPCMLAHSDRTRQTRERRSG